MYSKKCSWNCQTINILRLLLETRSLCRLCPQSPFFVLFYLVFCIDPRIVCFYIKLIFIFNETELNWTNMEIYEIHIIQISHNRIYFTNKISLSLRCTTSCKTRYFAARHFIFISETSQAAEFMLKFKGYLIPVNWLAVKRKHFFFSSVFRHAQLTITNVRGCGKCVCLQCGRIHLPVAWR